MGKALSGRAADKAARALDIAGAIRILEAHPAITGVSAGAPAADGSFRIDFDVEVELWSTWKAAGESPNGVRRIEPMSLLFFKEFPLQAPVPLLREDFDCSKAHIVRKYLGRPIPCLFDGDPNEAMNERGFVEFVNQVPHWLSNAAHDTLIDPKQGWEPVRRDSMADAAIADPTALRRLVGAKGGYAFFKLDYGAVKTASGDEQYLCAFSRDQLSLTHESIGLLQIEARVPGYTFGQGLGLLVWPGPDANGKPVVADKYLPETVTDLESLKERAELYGCSADLQKGVSEIITALSGWTSPVPLPIAIVLVARRPFPLDRSDSDLELCPYLLLVKPPVLFPNGAKQAVRPMALRDAISRKLMRRMSGLPDGEAKRDWTLLGAGSLGSKIGVHAARSGLAPTRVVDRRSLMPHNAARHGLLPLPGSMQHNWLGSKAAALAEAMQGLGGETIAHEVDVVPVLRDRLTAKKYLPKNSQAILNTTASLTVREAFAATPRNVRIPRVIEAGLMGRARVGFMTVEGPSRNPNSGELFAELTERLRADLELRKIVFGEADGFERQRVGDGCGSVTLAVSDAEISTLAAPMATFVTRMLLDKLPETGGKIAIGQVQPDGVSVSWSSHDVAAFERLKTEDAVWTVSISPRADVKIREEVRRFPKVETGGVLVGRLSEPSRTFYVTDVIAAPPDSRRSPIEFVLGKEGLPRTLDEIVKATNGALSCVGTWHSHLHEFGPSMKDRAAAETIAERRMAPSVLLIRTPGGYRALSTTELKPPAVPTIHKAS